MKSIAKILSAALVVAALAGCTTLSDQDRALLNSASQNAAAAKDQAAQANTTAQQALQAAQAAQASAASAAADAKSAKDEADRIYSRSLRK